MANYFLNDDGSLTKKNKKKKGNNYILQDNGTITLNSSDKEDMAPVKKTTNSFSEDTTKKQLLEKRQELQDELLEYNKPTVGNFFKTLLGVQDKEYKDDENYKRLQSEYDRINTEIENYSVENKKYQDGFMGFIEKSNDTILGNVKTAEKGITTSVKKILGQEVTEEDYGQHYYERLGQKAVQESSGVEKIALDVQGSVARMVPQMAIGGASKLGQIGATALGFANYGGGAYNQARQDGYSDEQATAYGIAIGGMEMALTKALGSFSNVYGKTKVGNFSQGIINKTIPKIISNKQVREVMAQFGSEATEEFLQEYIDGIAKDTLLDGEGLLKSTWKNITDPDKFSDALYSALVGGITGSTMATPSAIDNYRYEKTTGRDAETRLTANEQTVLDAVKEQRTTEIQKERALKTEIDKEIKEFEATFGKMTESEKKGIRDRIQEKLDNSEIDYSTSKLSKKEITKIEQEVREDLEKGYIDIDTIESTLTSEKTAQIKELEARMNETTNEQEKAEIQAQISELTNAKNTELQGMLGKDLYLQRSYREANLQKEKFFYEPTGYESEYKRSLAKDFEKVANNTTKSHETFEMLSKLAEDKQTNYGVINNEQLKQLGYDVEGKDVNGLVRVNEDGTQKVLINIDSDKAINRIIGHETTHLLEGTKEYTELQQMIKEYATTKGDYDTKLKEITKLYDGIDADVEAEVTSELVGDYLFTDTDFINNLSTQKPTIFQKIYNEIKHLYKMATAGSKEARQLEKVKKAFDKAYKQNVTSKEAGIKYSIVGIKNIQKTLNNKNIDNNQKQFLNKILDNYNDALTKENTLSNEEIRKETGWFKDKNGDWKFEITDAYSDLKVVPKANTEYKLGDILEHKLLFDIDPSLKDVKVVFVDKKSGRGNYLNLPLARRIIINNKLISEGKKSVKSTILHEVQHHNQYLNKFEQGISSGKTLQDMIDYVNNLGEIEAKTVQERMELSQKELRNITPESAKEKPQHPLKDELIEKRRQEIENSSKNRYNNKKKGWKLLEEEGVQVLQESENENSNSNIRNGLKELDDSSFFDAEYSLSNTDNQGRTLTKEQQEYFKDSKERDIDGSLKEMYHGTKNYGFTVFDRKYAKSSGNFGTGIYFAPTQDYSNAYGEMYKVYLNIKNPVDAINKQRTLTDEQVKKLVEAVANNEDYGIENYGYNATIESVTNDLIQHNNDFEIFQDLDITCVGDFAKLVELSNEVLGTDFDGIRTPLESIVFNSNQIKNVDNTNPTSDADIRYSLGNQDIAPVRSDVFGSDIKLQVEETITPLKETIAELKEVLDPDYESTVDYSSLTESDLPMVEQQNEQNFRNVDESNMPIEQEDTTPETETEVTTTRSLEDVRDFDEVGSRKVKAYQYENPEVRPYFQEMATYMIGDLENSVKGERNFNDQLYYDTAGEQGFYGTTRQTTDDIAELLDSKYNYTYKDIRKGLEAIIEDHGAENIAVAKRIELALDKRLREGYTDVTGYEIPANQEYLKLLQEKEISDYYSNIPIDESFVPEVKTSNKQVTKNIAPVRRNVDWDSVEDTSQGNQIAFNNEGKTVEVISELEKKQQRAYKKLGSKEDYISNQAYELYDEVKNLKKGVKASYELGRVLDVAFANINALTEGMTETKAKEVRNKIWRDVTTSLLNVKAKPLTTVNKNSTIEAVIRQNIGREYDSKKNDIANMKEEDLVTKTKKELRKALLGTEVQKEFITSALDNAKNRSMALMNNTDTIRNTELVFGRDAGRTINEVIFQKEIDNEADSIAWQNKERQEIKDLGIKARSKESAAVQKYGEKQYVNEYDEVVPYGDKELANEFDDIETQKKIKKAAQVIRNKYDNYIDRANEVLTGLGFDPIPKRNDYMRHFQELNDVFSRHGIPFNAQSMAEHTLPTDINGLTEFWSPQKNYFANMQARKGIKTTYDAITGVDGYIGGIANLIYHTEDIQRGRAFEELIRETYGEDKGWDNLENLPEEIQKSRAEKIQDNHLSNYAAWVHEWTNNVAGKKSKIDRSVESMFGRKAFSFLDTARKQVGSNMIGFNLSSSLTNLIAPVQATAKTNKLAVLKGTADTIKNMFIKDDFMSKNKFLTSRMGTDMISKNAWQKVQDAGFVFMKGMDWFSSNQIVRSKFYELRAKGMSEAEAHTEAGKFAARILGDRTKGANAQLYNSKLIGLVTQFQLEVNNQLYSTFYDTYHESKENAQNNALKTAAGMTFTLGQLFAFTHLFGQTFEAIAGYNPTMDIVEILKTALGWGEDDDEEKTTSERLKDAADQLVDALPYVNILTGGGRIPVASGLPNLVGVATGGKDQYGNELKLEDELKKLLFLIPPTGGNQFKKTTQGLGMFDEDLPISGSYTNSGNLRFPVEDTIQNRIQAGLFGQYANENASYYFDNELAPLKEKQIEEFIEMDIPYKEYREYRKELSDVNKTTADKDENGKTISGTAAGKKAYKIMNGDYSKKEKERLLEGLSSETYRITTSDLNKLNNNEELYKYYFSLSTKGKSDFINAINNYGFNAETLYEANVTLKNIEDNYSKLNNNGNNLSKQKKQAIKNAISQYTTTNAQYNYLYHKIYKK